MRATVAHSAVPSGASISDQCSVIILIDGSIFWQNLLFDNIGHIPLNALIDVFTGLRH